MSVGGERGEEKDLRTRKWGQESVKYFETVYFITKSFVSVDQSVAFHG